jgi:hypothetical protein
VLTIFGEPEDMFEFTAAAEMLATCMSLYGEVVRGDVDAVLESIVSESIELPLEQ